MPEADTTLTKAKQASSLCALLAVGIGATGLAGWVFDIPALQRIHPSLVTMKFNAAFGLILAGTSLIMQQNERDTGPRRWVAQALATVICLLGWLTLGEHIFDWDLGIDQFFFHESQESAGRSFPGRMGIASAVVFICLGTALMFLDCRISGKFWATRCAVGSAVATTLVFLYYFFGIERGEAISKYATIALHTTVAFYAMSMGIFFARPHRGVMLELVGPGLGSVVARRMLPAAFFLPILLGWLGAMGRHAGWVSQGFATAAFVLLIILLFTGLIRWAVITINRQEAERKRTEIALRRSEANLRDFVDNAPMGLQWIGPDGTLLWANQAQLRMLGYSSEEYIGHPVADFHTDAAVIAQILDRLAKGEALHECRATLRHKDGSVRQVLINSNARFEDGRFIHTRCFTLDITERLEAEAAQARLAAIVMSCNDGILSKSLEGIITSWNPGAEKIFGYTAAEMTGQSILRLVPPDLVEEEALILAKLKAGERMDHFETERVTKDGRRLPVSLTISPIFSAAGTIIGASKIVRDITERRQSETDLRESEARFRLMADNIQQLTWMADADGRFFWFNKRWFDYTGLTPETMKDRGWERVHDTRELPRVWEYWHECVAKGQLWEDIFPLRGADGEFRWFLSRAVPVRDAEGKVVRWFGTNTDVHDQRLISEALAEAKERAEAASRAKDDFLAALSHELRTPLTPVLMMAAALTDDSTLTPEVREQLAMMRRNIELEARLIDDLLDLTRINRGKLVIAPVVADVHQLLSYTAEIVQSDRLGKDVSITFRQEAVRHHALADPARLQQVFWNLIKNAIKFTPAGGSITVSTRNDAEGRVILSVEDTGVGISAEAQPHIFEAFEQGDAAGQHRYGGLGLGLAISRAIMTAHGGTISGTSAGLGQGAVFTIALASVDAPADAPHESTAAASSTRGLRLLIVEDHATTRAVLAQLLTRRGHLVTTADTAEEALNTYAAGTFDAVISDLGLPDSSGLELMEKIQALRPVPAIALSGYGMEDDLRQTKEAGFFAHLVKPVNLDQLRHLIDQITPGTGEK